ncbi:MAG: DUF4040 domain-containing protein [Chlorobi bacterium]|nr:DUF4040 domain-containing protein [Chlorobiota bacterium]
MFNLLAILLGISTIVFALVAIYTKKLIFAILATGGVSLFASILYLLMAAPDVALTEAAIGSGLTTLIFLFILNKIKEEDV